MAKGDASELAVEFRSLGEPELQLIHRYQNLSCTMELSDAMDFEPPYLPVPLDKIKAKLEELGKQERTYVLGVWSKDNQFVGMAMFYGDFDPWSPWSQVFIWPEFRRKGYGTAAARLLMERTFKDTVTHVVSCFSPGWNDGSQKFIEKLGFKKAGARRRSYFIDGKYYDGVFYDMLRKEYYSKYAKGGGR